MSERPMDVPIEGGVLRPLANTPEREREVWRNADLRASLARGLAQSAAGEVHDLGSFIDAPCSNFVTLDLEDRYFDGQTLPDALTDYDHVHSNTGICVKRDGRWPFKSIPPHGSHDA